MDFWGIDKLISILFILIQTCGAKNVKKYFLHESSDFEPLIFFVFSVSKGLSWESLYVLLEWFSVLLLMPFDFERLDSDLIAELENLTGVKF